MSGYCDSGHGPCNSGTVSGKAFRGPGINAAAAAADVLPHDDIDSGYESKLVCVCVYVCVYVCMHVQPLECTYNRWKAGPTSSA
jgi:hypothetical protein